MVFMMMDMMKFVVNELYGIVCVVCILGLEIVGKMGILNFSVVEK